MRRRRRSKTAITPGLITSRQSNGQRSIQVESVAARTARVVRVALPALDLDGAALETGQVGPALGRRRRRPHRRRCAGTVAPGLGRRQPMRMLLLRRLLHKQPEMTKLQRGAKAETSSWLMVVVPEPLVSCAFVS